MTSRDLDGTETGLRDIVAGILRAHRGEEYSAADALMADDRILLRRVVTVVAEDIDLPWADTSDYEIGGDDCD